jgi:hypothetical protein
MKPQPFDPPVAEARVWEIPREGIPELASILYAYVTWGRDPHPSQVSEAYQKGWHSVRARWEFATTELLEMLERIGHVQLVSDKQSED